MTTSTAGVTKLNYNIWRHNIFLRMLEKGGLLSGAWTGMNFEELPPHIQKEVEKIVALMRLEFRYEDRE